MPPPCTPTHPPSLPHCQSDSPEASSLTLAPGPKKGSQVCCSSALGGKAIDPPACTHLCWSLSIFLLSPFRVKGREIPTWPLLALAKKLNSGARAPRKVLGTWRPQTASNAQGHPLLSSRPGLQPRAPGPWPLPSPAQTRPGTEDWGRGGSVNEWGRDTRNTTFYPSLRVRSPV